MLEEAEPGSRACAAARTVLRRPCQQACPSGKLCLQQQLQQWEAQFGAHEQQRLFRRLLLVCYHTQPSHT